MKYILFEGDLLPEEMMIFFETANHAETAFQLGVKHKIISAGFIKIGEGGQAECYGYSDSLEVESRGEQDAKVFNRHNKMTRMHP